MSVVRRFGPALRSLMDPSAPQMLFFLLKVFLGESLQRLLGYRFYSRTRSAGLGRRSNRPIRVALLIDEYFGGFGTAFGGYGFLARRLVAKHLPNEDFLVEVILHGHKVNGLVLEENIDGTVVYKLSASDRLSRYWLAIKRYDAFLSIELTSIDAIRLAPRETPHILWIQDPRPISEWEEIATVTLFPEPSYYDQRIYDYVADRQENIRFVTQGVFLNGLARQLYSLSPDVSIQFLPNPVDVMDEAAGNDSEKENIVIFLGRIDSVKRGWIFCELAKRMPEYQFHVLGAIHNNVERNKAVLSPYIDEKGVSKVANLHFEGHVDGAEKQAFLRRAKVLVNTSIHEALPVSFLEALAARVLLVSCRNPEGLTESFGYYTGPVLGNGFDRVDDFVIGVREIIGDEGRRRELALAGQRYVTDVHSVSKFQTSMRETIGDEVRKRRSVRLGASK